MKSAGIILTFMKWFSKWFLFNLGLFVYHLVLMVVGTVYGKIKWPKRSLNRIDIIILIALIALYEIIPRWWNVPIYIIAVFCVIAMVRGIDWRKVWRAAQVCHVRLCLRDAGTVIAGRSLNKHPYEYISFTHPVAKLDYWRMEHCDGKRYRYYNPTFNPSPEFIKAMIQYAYDQVGKPYDVPQLASYALNLAIWIACPWTWGREVIRTFNKPGGHESCSSGVTADLRWAENASHRLNINRFFAKELGISINSNQTRHFKGYDTATVSPCLYELSKNWEHK